MTNGFSKARSIIYSLLAFLLYLCIFLAAYPQIIFCGQTFFRRDILRFYYPIWNLTVHSINQGVLPLWDPYSYCGSPFLANPESCVFYPFTIFLYLPHYAWAFNFYILFHLAMAGFFTALWVTDCGGSKSAALLSGIAYGLGGYMASTINLTISLCAAAYFPLTLLAFRRSLLREGFAWKGITAIVLLCQYLAGDPAVSYATLFVFSLFTFYKTLENFYNNKNFSWNFLSSLGQILLLFLGLGAFQILLFVEFLYYSQRWTMGSPERTLWSIQYNDLLGILIPFFSDISMSFMNYWQRQSWLENYYSGGTVVILSLAACYFGRKKPLVGYHVLLALLGLSLSLGQFSPVYPFCVRWVPLFHFIRYPVRFFFLFNFGMACLCGFGMDLILTASRATELVRNRRARLWSLCLLVLSFVVIVCVTHFESIQREIQSTLQEKLGVVIKSGDSLKFMKEASSAALVNAMRTALLMLLTMAGVITLRFLKPRRDLAALFFFTLVFVDLFTANVFEPSLPKEILDKPSSNLVILLKDHSLFRIFPSPKAAHMQVWGTGRPHGELQEDQKELLINNYIMLYGIQSLNGYNSIYLKDIENVGSRLTRMKWPSQTKLMSALNIKYLVSPNEMLHYGFTLMNKTPFTNLFKNTNSLPRAYLVKTVEVVTNHEVLLERFTNRDFNPKQRVLLEENPSPLGEWRPGRKTGEKNSVHFIEYSPNRVQMTVTVLDKPWLFFSDAYYPGWKAVVDGCPIKIYRANYAFRALQLSPGKHDIVWTYDPALFKVGLCITCLTVLGFLWSIFHNKREYQRPAHALNSLK